MDKQLKDINHNYLRYANCWEDADVLLEGLEIEEGDKVLSIASAGDNSFSLLMGNPELVIAVDINPVQLHLVRLKKVAIQALSRDEFLGFIGFTESNTRQEVYSNLRSQLPAVTQKYWDIQIQMIKEGLIHQGKFEKYFQLFRKKILPFIHTKKRISRLFAQKDERAQKQFYNKKWNNWRWRLLFKFFFSKAVMGKVGRDPKFLEEVDVNVSRFIFNTAANHLSSVIAQDNYFLQYILTGTFKTNLPHYVRKENYQKIKNNINQLIVYQGFAEKVLEEYQGINKFNLSNIFEYMDRKTFQSVGKKISSQAPKNSKFAYWNLMVPRFLHTVNKNLKPNSAISKKMKPIDKGFFYGKFIIDKTIK